MLFEKADTGMLICDQRRKTVAYTASTEWLEHMCELSIVGKGCSEVFGRPLCRSCPFEADKGQKVIGHRKGQVRTVHLRLINGPPRTVKACPVALSSNAKRLCMVATMLWPLDEAHASEEIAEKDLYAGLVVYWFKVNWNFHSSR